VTTIDRRVCLLAAVVLASASLAACGGSSTSHPLTPSAKLQRLGASGTLSIVLTNQGAQRIGIQTAPAVAVARSGAHRAPRGLTVFVPYAALLYEPDGQPVVFTNPAPLVYTQQPVTVDHISGDRVYLGHGPAPGTRVVTVGGEELLGVQNGVGAET
jgi:hypothetical protein